MSLLALAFGAQRVNLERAAQQPELAEFGAAVEHPLEARNLDIADAPAADAYHMMMRGGIAVVACAVVQRGNLARLADAAEGLERAMDGGERDVRMFAAYGGVDSLGARMLVGVEQGADDGEALGRDREATAMAALGELRHAPGIIPGPPALIYHLHFHLR